MPIRGVLFDFSGTLFHLGDEQSWLDAALDEAGTEIDEQTRTALLTQLVAPKGQAARLPAEMHDAWERRDLDPDVNYEVYQQLLASYGAPAEIADGIYRQMLEPHNWWPYPDTVDTLRWLRDAGVKVGVVSNIVWDIRAVFARHGVDELVHSFVLSYEFGAMKPDPRIFEHACVQLGVPPADTLMVGDSSVADGGATAVGSTFAQVDPLPTAQRPRALLDILRVHLGS